LRRDGGGARGFGAPDEVEKLGGAMAWAARRGEIIIWDANSSVN
jgi:hypothetical protein